MNSRLSDSLTDRIRKDSPLPFDVFMERSLYEPGLGFYASGQTRTGREGDFLTPVSPGPVLGELLARQADELHDFLGRPTVLHLIEQGADAGWLSRDLLLAVQKNHPRLAPCARLQLLEPRPPWEQKQRQTLREAGLEKSVEWYSGWEAYPKGRAPGFFYSCELVDSFPVKILQYRDGTWWEKWVESKEIPFAWLDREASPEILTQVRHWNPPEVEGYTLELRPGARSWVQSWAGKIPCGMILTLDYGFPAAQLFSPARSAGTLVATRNHQRAENPLADPGQLDLTAHVNFTELEELATECGWRNRGLTDFARGLTALAAPLFKQEKGLSDSWIRNFRHLTHPSFFGHSHQILVQDKGLPESFTPSIVMKV